jgi:hypothetical protein
MLRSILYMSDSMVGIASGNTQIEEMVRLSRIWNSSVGITGALVFTERHFVQFFEGPPAWVDDLLGKLHNDKRHSRIRVIEDAGADVRQFEDWSLAYSGPDRFIDQHIPPLICNQEVTALRPVAGQLRSRLRAMAYA